jgi:hypothetical protein
MQKPAKFLVVIDSGGGMVARMFDAQRQPQAEFDASSSEVAVMTQGIASQRSAVDASWDAALSGHSASERQEAEVYALDV